MTTVVKTQHSVRALPQGLDAEFRWKVNKLLMLESRKPYGTSLA